MYINDKHICHMSYLLLQYRIDGPFKLSVLDKLFKSMLKAIFFTKGKILAFYLALFSVLFSILENE